MEKFNKCDLLPCLQNSDYCSDFEEEVSVPKEYVVNDLNIKNDQELDCLLKKLSFWKIRQIPHETYEYVSSNLKGYRFTSYKFDLYEELSLLSCHQIGPTLLSKCLKEKRDNLTEFVADKMQISKDNKIDMLRYDKIELLKQVLKKEGKKEHSRYQNNLLEYVLFTGNLPLVELMIEEYGYKFDNTSIGAAVVSGNLELLKYICKNGASLEREFNAGYWIENGYEMHVEHYPADDYVFSAIVFGSDKCLEYLLERGLDISEVEKWLNSAKSYLDIGTGLSARLELDWKYYHCTKEKYNRIVDVYNKFSFLKREQFASKRFLQDF